jgi:hypothetical protein
MYVNLDLVRSLFADRARGDFTCSNCAGPISRCPRWRSVARTGTPCCHLPDPGAYAHQPGVVTSRPSEEGERPRSVMPRPPS